MSQKMSKNFAIMLTISLSLTLLLSYAYSQIIGGNFSPNTVLFTDDFESYSTFPATPWTDHNPSTTTWGTVLEAGGQSVRQSTTTSSTTAILSVGDTAWSNYSVSSRVKAGVTGYRVGVIGRLTSTQAYYRLFISFSTATPRLVVEKRVGGSNVTMTSVNVSGLAVGQYYKLTLSMNGSTIKGLIDDVEKTSIDDATYANGKVGYYCTADSYYDDLVVQDFNSPPGQPTALTATGNSSGIALAWTAAGGATSYKVKRSTTAGGPYTEIASPTTNSYTDGAVSNGTTYYYVVSAVNANGESSNSSEVSAMPAFAATAAPTGLISAGGDKEARLAWTAPSGVVNSYKLYRSLSSSGTYSQVASNILTPSFTDTGLTNGTTYYYKVSAVNDVAESALSSSRSVTPRLGMVVNVTPSTYSSAITNAVGGDEIVLADGEYAGSKIQIKYGTFSKPIIIRSANPLGAVFTSGQIELDRTEYITVKGVKNVSNYGMKFTGASYCRLTESSIELNETALEGIDWMTIYGANSHNNRIDHNEFKNKLDQGNFITIGGPSGIDNAQISQYDRIDHNYFYNIGPRAVNEKEAVRIGDSKVSRSSGFITVEYNLFELCDGDPEIISIKTSDNIVRYNTFRNSQGGLTARQGNRSEMYGNFFIADGIKDGTGGIRVYGDDHKIYNNYFEGLTGTGFSSPLSIPDGDADNADAAGADQSKHYRPRRIMVANNTFVGNVANIELGDSSSSYTLASQNITLANNIVVGSTGALIKVTTAPITPTYSSNIVFPTGSATVGISGLTTQFNNIDPQLLSGESIKKLGSASPAIDASDPNLVYVFEDVEGQLRDTRHDIGADEYGSSSSSRQPLISSNAGLSATDHAIYGRIVNSLGDAVPNVTVRLSSLSGRIASALPNEVVTDPNGRFIFTNIVNGDYTVNISRQYLIFTPDTININALSDDFRFESVSSLSPTAAGITVSGMVVKNGNPLAGITVELSNSNGIVSTSRTNPLGYFVFDDVAAGGSYIIRALGKGHNFEPMIFSADDNISDILIEAGN